MKKLSPEASTGILPLRFIGVGNSGSIYDYSIAICSLAYYNCDYKFMVSSDFVYDFGSSILTVFCIRFTLLFALFLFECFGDIFGEMLLNPILFLLN